MGLDKEYPGMTAEQQKNTKAGQMEGQNIRTLAHALVGEVGGMMAGNSVSGPLATGRMTSHERIRQMIARRVEEIHGLQRLLDSLPPVLPPDADEALWRILSEKR